MDDENCGSSSSDNGYAMRPFHNPLTPAFPLPRSMSGGGRAGSARALLRKLEERKHSSANRRLRILREMRPRGVKPTTRSLSPT